MSFRLHLRSGSPTGFPYHTHSFKKLLNPLLWSPTSPGQVGACGDSSTSLKRSTANGQRLTLVACRDSFLFHQSLITSHQSLSEHPIRIRVLSERSASKDLSQALSRVFATHPRNLPLTPFVATLPKIPSRKSFGCHTCDPLPRVLLQKRASNKDASLACPERGRRERAQRAEGSFCLLPTCISRTAPPAEPQPQREQRGGRANRIEQRIVNGGTSAGNEGLMKLIG